MQIACIYGHFLKTARAYTGALLVSAAVAMSGCGGGGDGGYVPPPPAFDIGILVAGQPLSGVAVLPGQELTVYLTIGQTFALESTGPVVWSVLVGGASVPESGATITYGGATIQEVLTTTTRFAVFTGAFAPLISPVQVRVYAMSLLDGNQVATINLVLSN